MGRSDWTKRSPISQTNKTIRRSGSVLANNRISFFFRFFFFFIFFCQTSEEFARTGSTGAFCRDATAWKSERKRDFHSSCASLHSPRHGFNTTENLTRVSASDSCLGPHFSPILANIARFLHLHFFFCRFFFSLLFHFFKFIFNFNKVLAPIYYITMFHSTPRNCKYINTYYVIVAVIVIVIVIVVVVIVVVVVVIVLAAAVVVAIVVVIVIVVIAVVIIVVV